MHSIPVEIFGNELWVEKSGGHRFFMTVSGDSLNLHAFDLSGGTWNPVVVDVSGGHAIRIAGSFAADISGQPVDVSGSPVKISGQTVVILSGLGVRVSGESIRISPESGRGKVELHGYDFSGASWTPVGVDISGGSALKIAGSIAANVSGQTVVTLKYLVRLLEFRVQL